MSEPLVSVIIPALDVASTLGEQLDALCREHVVGGFEVIVADNGSTDGTRELAMSYADRLDIRVIDASARRGCGAARNAGSAAAHGRYLVYIDGDDLIHAGYLQAMAEGLGHAELVSSATIDEWGGRPTGSGTAAVKINPSPLPSASGSNLGVRREVLQRLGGFDERMQYAGEDIDFCWRVHLAGGRLEGVPDAVLSYRLVSSVRGQFRKGLKYGQAIPQLARRYPELVRVEANPLQTARLLAAHCWRVLRARSVEERGARPSTRASAGADPRPDASP